MRPFTEDELDDMEAGLRIAASCIEMTSRNFKPEVDEVSGYVISQAQEAMGRQANRFRTLARIINNRRGAAFDHKRT